MLVALVMLTGLLPAQAVAKAKKMFGAAILKKPDHSVVLAATNHTSLNPLWHGELMAMKKFWEMHKPFRINPKDSIFFATHEPCPYCLAAIAWNGFDNFYFLFSYEDSKKRLKLPYNLKILKEVFKLGPGGYSHENSFWTAYNIKDMVKNCPADKKAKLEARIKKIAAKYDKMSADYQQVKDKTIIPFK